MAMPRVGAAGAPETLDEHGRWFREAASAARHGTSWLDALTRAAQGHPGSRRPERQAGTKRRKHKAFLLGAWRNEE